MKKSKSAKKINKIQKQSKSIPKQKKTDSVSVDNTSPKSRVMSCIVTGLERRVSKAGVAKGCKKFGDLVAFMDHYVSNEAKRLLRQRISPEEVQKQLRPAHKKPFSIDKQVLARLKLLKKQRNKKMTMEEVQQISIKWVPKEPRNYSSIEAYVADNTKNNVCIAPHIYLDNDRTCDYCKYYEYCKATIKQVSKNFGKRAKG